MHAIVICHIHTRLNFSAQEFQSLTAETDADANEDEHIKALFAEVDSNKDGKVFFSRVFFLSFSRYFVPHAPKPVPYAR